MFTIGMLVVGLWLCAPAEDAQNRAAGEEFDLVVVGGTPAGVCAGVAAARMGRSVAIIEETTRLGGMLSGGLCHLDKRYFASVSGILRQWCDLNRDYYLKHLPDDPVVRAAPAGYDMSVRQGTKFEPHVAERHFGRLVAEAKRIRVFYRSWPVEAIKRQGAIRTVVVENAQGERRTIGGRQFIDATDAGDLAALAGVPFRVGREPRTPQEPHAGRIYTPAFVSVMGRHPAPRNMDTGAHWSTLLRQGCVLYFYRDIDAGHPAFTAIEQLSLRGAFRGDEKHRFRPDEPVTRGAAAEALVAALKWPWSVSGSHFRDCRATHGAFRAVETLFDHASMAGSTAFGPDADGRFRPEAPLGGEIAAWLQALALPPAETIPAPMTRAALASLIWKAVEVGGK